MLITEKIEKIKKNCVDFFESLRQFSVKFNDPEAISKQLTAFNNKVLITEKIQKIKKYINDFFKGLRQFFLKFKYPQAISKQLTILIKR